MTFHSFQQKWALFYSKSWALGVQNTLPHMTSQPWAKWHQKRECIHEVILENNNYDFLKDHEWMFLYSPLLIYSSSLFLIKYKNLLIHFHYFLSLWWLVSYSLPIKLTCCPNLSLFDLSFFLFLAQIFWNWLPNIKVLIILFIWITWVLTEKNRKIKISFQDSTKKLRLDCTNNQ